ncbi:ECU10_0805 [Encephalitozoon cuniculi GB-M1]|uniref:ECU10_0805 protein n=1 Tax=Encephalitozoon cuniculi (strain GB-M1) TaxID=284813 RepID=A0A1T5PD71_ENCCU|nr:uncharacterized protein ECU10_0805 [Encephalitozoon cuniculi GB-M1]KMV65232.1 hypothetical protein M970_100720 [Encephalitozoon cuniculi EcunIII-L]SKD10708.1 ECU10_0805 [Encephalitozoon cuniculi GB-M1]
MLFKDKLEMVTSFLALILMVSTAPRYFYGNQVLVAIVTYSTFVSFMKPIAKRGKLYFRIVNVLHVIAKIVTLIAFFVVMNNVFVMRIGYRNCSRCSVMSMLDVAASILFLAYYSAYSTAFVFFFSVSNK